MQNIIITKNTTRAGKGELRTPHMNVPVSVQKVAGVFQCSVEGRYAGLNRVTAQEAWELLAEYLSAGVVEDKSFK
jgi:hypothetical protein